MVWAVQRLLLNIQTKNEISLTDKQLMRFILNDFDEEILSIIKVIKYYVELYHTYQLKPNENDIFILYKDIPNIEPDMFFNYTFWLRLSSLISDQYILFESDTIYCTSKNVFNFINNYSNILIKLPFCAVCGNKMKNFELDWSKVKLYK